MTPVSSLIRPRRPPAKRIAIGGALPAFGQAELPIFAALD